ncbi:MAG TPA: SOS response-associated peptidase [Streptosporangiaceae bacterium]|jgi:putative SOS response-associated peptidase YedK
MCGRFVSARERQALIDEFSVERDEVTSELALDWNVAPTDSIYAVLTRTPRDQRDGPLARELHTVRWGLIPSWAKDPFKGGREGKSTVGRLINARAETVTAKPSFRSAFARRRCLIPADGYYEWRTVASPDGGKPRKQPYFIHRADGTGMAFAGLYELWRDQSLPSDHPKAWLWTATIITTTATDEVGWVHDRMPMVISPDRWAEWLDPAPADADRLLHAMAPASADALETRPVSTAVNSVRNDGPDLIAPVTEEVELGNA